jgi:hypothetical protein
MQKVALLSRLTCHPCKTQNTPKAAISALEGLTVEQHVSWKKAMERIKKLLE